MSTKSKQDWEEILAVGDSALTAFSTRLTKATHDKFLLIMAHYQSQVKVSIRTRISKQDVIEKIICDQYEILTKQSKAQQGLALQLIEEHNRNMTKS